MARIGHFILLAVATWLAVSPASAQDAASFDWRGFYAGYHSGGALGLVDVADPYGPSIFGDTVRTPGSLAGGQAGYNWQHGATVFGLEADASWADLDGTNTCFAYSGRFVSSNCRTRLDALGTFAGRLGWALPFDDGTLLFAKAGLAWAHGKTAAKPNGGLALAGADDSGFDVGWTLGAGVERAIAPRWTVRAEYAFLDFGDDGFTAPASRLQTNPPDAPFTPTPPTATTASVDVHAFKIAMNYRFGGVERSSPDAPAPVFRRAASPARTEITAGVRYVYGWGQFHKDLGIEGEGVTSLASRLTYDNSGTHGAETFARLDTPFGLMVKGLLGGADGGGRLNDEDWELDFPNAHIPYSNTISDVDDKIRYWMIDVGYDWRRDARAKVASFVGYSRFKQDMEGLGCRQIANSFSDCGTAIATSVPVIEEDDTWRALRLGTAVDFAVAPRLTLSGEAAYLPYVRFTGTDNHLLRKLVSPEEGHGTGMQLEAMLSYAVTDALSLGVGGRYWSVWTTEGEVNFGGTGTIVPMRYAAEQAHVLVQGSYRFDVAPAR